MSVLYRVNNVRLRYCFCNKSVKKGKSICTYFNKQEFSSAALFLSDTWMDFFCVREENVKKITKKILLSYCTVLTFFCKRVQYGGGVGLEHQRAFFCVFLGTGFRDGG